MAQRRPAAAALVAGAIALALGAAAAGAAQLSLTYKGFNYVSYYNGGYENADSLSSLAGAGANSAAMVLEYGIDVGNSIIYTDANYTDSLAILGSTITEAKGLGLSVMVRPLIDFLDPAKIGPNNVGDYRAYFNPSNPAAFFASYKTMIVAQAQVAQAKGAQLLSIGGEIDQLTGPQYLSYWTDIIAAIRAVYSGKLTYSAIWDDNMSPWLGHNGLAAGTGNLATQVSFWSQLDFVGIDCYAPISDAANPTLDQLIAGWTQVPSDPTSLALTGNQSLISYFQGVAAQVGKPLIFTELGYESATDAAYQPYGTSTNVFDPALQANLYQAFFTAWSSAGNGALVGVYFWNWDPNASEVGPNNGANFSPQQLAAQSIVATAFAGGGSAQGSVNRSFVSGHGSDANPCSLAAPCRTFAQAVAQTNPGGEVTILDPAGYGAVTIGKALSIVNDGVGEAGITVASGNAITIVAGLGDVVNLRGLTMVGGGSAANGIFFAAGGTVDVQNCVIRGFAGDGIRVEPGSSAQLNIADTTLSNNGGNGVAVEPGGSGTLTAIFERVQALGNSAGGFAVSAAGTTGIVAVSARDSTASGSPVGFAVSAAAGQAATNMTISNSLAANNATGLQSSGPNATMAIAATSLSGNATGYAISGGAAILSAGDNAIVGTTHSGTLGTLARR